MSAARSHDFPGPKGDESRHLGTDQLLSALEALPPPPTDRGRVDLIVSRDPDHVRQTHERVVQRFQRLERELQELREKNDA